jgi:hypothetical protein
MEGVMARVYRIRNRTTGKFLNSAGSWGPHGHFYRTPLAGVAERVRRVTDEWEVVAYELREIGTMPALAGLQAGLERRRARRQAREERRTS